MNAMKYFIFILSLIVLFSCNKEVAEPKKDIRPLIPGEYHGEISIIEFNTVTEEFDLNPDSISISAVIRKIDHPYNSLYEIEFSENPADFTPIRFTLYPYCYINIYKSIYGDGGGYECASYERSAKIHVQYEQFGSCLQIPHIDLKDGGTFFNTEDSMRVSITRHFCSDPENTFKIEFTGSQLSN